MKRDRLIKTVHPFGEVGRIDSQYQAAAAINAEKGPSGDDDDDPSDEDDDRRRSKRKMM